MNLILVSYLFANQLRIHYLFRQFTIYFANSIRIHNLFRKFTSNSLSESPIYFEFTIFFANSFSIHYLFHEFTFNSLPISLIHYEFTIFSRSYIEFIIFLLSSRKHIDITILFPNWLWIHLLIREFNSSSLSLSRIHSALHILFANRLRFPFVNSKLS